ncbi:MAG: thioredoxin domain-containing protein [Miltoncostaeaceae bacterium]
MNRLAAEPSLYLRQHADNPVDWYPWGEEALARARAEDRPILLSIGYSACHWCHVMAHESFEDPATAAVMNEHFVCVKVDREERPDVDALYMQATLALTGSGGWPMTVFITPDGRPFYAGTYFPREPRGGMPGFGDLCAALAEAYRERPDEVQAQAERATTRLRAAAERGPREGIGDGGLDASLLDDAMLGLARQLDPLQGGFGGAPKFPPSLALEFLAVRAMRPGGDRHAAEMLDLTLARMSAGGIHDQLGGGFHRYTVDGQWLVPHFEKMLYDNALIGRAYALAHRATGQPDHIRVAKGCFDYLLREMRLPGGPFAAAQDADTEEGEGAFFVWTPQQLADLLPPDQARAIALRYGVTPEGNFEGNTTILRPVIRLADLSRQLGTDAMPLLEQARATMYAARSRRPRPARDDKVIAAWNGLAIAGLADAGRLLDRMDFVDAASAAAAFVLDVLVVDGRLHRTHMGGRTTGLGMLDDHAALAHGLLCLFAATHQARWLTEARTLAERMLDLFDDGEGGFYYTGSDAEELLARTRDVEDHPTPSGNSLAASVLLRLADLTLEPAMQERALTALARVREDMARVPHAFGAALAAVDRVVAERRQVVVVGAPDDEGRASLATAAEGALGPHDVLVVGDPEDEATVAAVPLLAGRGTVDGRAAAYVCHDFACRAPVTTAEEVTAALSAEA